MDLKKTRDTLTRIRGQVRTHRDASRTLAERLAAHADWPDLTPEAQQRRLSEARANLIAAARDDVDRSRQLAGTVLHGAEERLSTARYFREARFTADATLEELTRIRWALELPKTKEATLGAMALDCAQRGGDAAAALLTLVRRELDTRTDAGLSVKTDVATAEMRFPLPQALTEERALVAEIAEAADAIGSAWQELVGGGHRDVSDRLEHYRAGGAPPEMPSAADRAFPAMPITDATTPAA